MYLNVGCFTPEGLPIKIEAVALVLPTIKGEIEVLCDHKSLVTQLTPGMVTVRVAGNKTRKFFISGGFFEVNNNQCNIMVDNLRELGETELSLLESELGSIEKAIQDPSRKGNAEALSYLQSQQAFLASMLHYLKS